MSDALIYGKVVADHWQVLHRIAHSQKGLLDRRTGMIYFHLHEPFRTAARQFGWEESVPGIGLNEEFLDWAATHAYKVRVFVEGFNSKCYEASASWWGVWCRQHNSVWVLEEGVHLYELPWKTPYFRTVHAFDDTVIVEAWRLLSLLEAGKV